MVVACLVGLLGQSCAAAPHRAPLAGRAPSSSSWWKGIEYSGKLESRYSSNPFRYSDADRANLENENGPGQKFDGLERDSDLVTELGLEVARDFEWSDQHQLQVALGGEYNHFHVNDVGSYAKYEASVGVELGERDRVELSIEHTPDRFRRNYKLPSGLFADGSYEQTELALEYERGLTDTWTAGVGLGSYSRDYRSEFTFRDRDADGVSVFSSVRLAERVVVDTRLSLTDVETGVENRGGVLRDRSFETLELQPRLRVGFGRTQLRFELNYRRKEFTTDQAADTVRFDRVDDRYGARIEARRKLEGSGRRLRLYLEWLDNESDVSDPTATDDETGYEEVVVGVGYDLAF